jgi:hypothetical protein
VTMTTMINTATHDTCEKEDGDEDIDDDDDNGQGCSDISDEGNGGGEFQT